MSLLLQSLNGRFLSLGVRLMQWTQSAGCPVGSVLEFLQDKFVAGAATATLRVYVAAITGYRESDEVPLGRHHLSLRLCVELDA